MIICVCHAVSDREIEDCMTLGCSGVDELRDSLGVTSGCGRCHESVCEVIDAHALKSGRVAAMVADANH
ncbi:MAG: bacterioferritin-associated ferredoxin [Lautropia sp.]